MKTLLITEKPSVAREFARILSVSQSPNNGYFENQDYVITWCVGHLITMTLPDGYDPSLKKWSLATLPFLPKQYRYEVIPNVSKQYEVVRTLLNRTDISEILWAGDPAREGQYIEELVRMMAGVASQAVEKRVWIDSVTDNELRKGIQTAKPMSEYANLGASGYMRAIEDYAMGMNFSRVLSVQFGRMLNEVAETQKWIPVAVGRVMTCVLGMIVQREREIRNFVETLFYRIIAHLSGDETTFDAEWKPAENPAFYAPSQLYKDSGFLKREDAEALITRLAQAKTAEVKSIERKSEKKNPPMLFNLAELQAACAKKFKISPDETLNIAQELYEKKLTTYPRTDARVLSTAIAKVIGNNIAGLKSVAQVASFAAHILDNALHAKIAKTKYVDDSKISDHYAIIPTGEGITQLGTLSPTAMGVYLLICQRFLSIFYPAAVFSKVSLLLDIAQETFATTLKTLKEMGYLVVTGESGDEEGEKEEEDKMEKKEVPNDKVKLAKLMAKLKKGDILDVLGYDIREGKTSPPKRYNSGTMILAMENAGQLIEDAELREQIKGSGIGTSATRAEILKKLQTLEYIRLNAKTQILSPMKIGEMVYEIVYYSIPSLLNPKLTASWEKGLTQVAEGTTSKEEYLSKLNTFVSQKTEMVKGCSGATFYLVREQIRSVRSLYETKK